MRMRNPKNKDEIIKTCDYFYDTENIFENNNPIHIEIGMGKGQFILNMALQNPNINYIGIEKYTSVAALAIKKINEYKPSNLKIIIGDAINLKDLLKNKVSCIYLNFSDPWPKKRHTRRRLTSFEYLQSYDELFGDNEKVIIQKTDNDDLFAYSLEQFESYGYKIEQISYDLHNKDIPNIMTEYEEKFSQQGVKIKYVKVKK